MKFHPYAEVFPLLEGAQLDELAADIKANGLREAIWIYDGQILDGRNRFLACQRMKVRPTWRQYKGDDPLGFVVSLNVARRHLTDAQRAMAAARIATLKLGSNQHEGASRDAPSQAQAAEQLAVSRRSVQRARKILKHGSKQLQRAVETGDVGLQKAAAVVDKPKSQQLAAATAEDEDDGSIPEPGETERIAAYEREYASSIDKVMAADDKLAAANAEIKRQAAQIVTLKLSRDGYLNGQGEAVRQLKAARRQLEQREKTIKKLEDDIEKLRERVAIMEAA